MIALARIIFDILLLWWAGSYLWNGPLASRARKQRRQLKLMAKNLKHRRLWDRDLLDDETEVLLAKMQEDAIALSKAGSSAFEIANAAEAEGDDGGKKNKAKLRQPLVSEAEAFINNTSDQLSGTGAQPKKLSVIATIREWTEVVVVVFGVVMGARALYLQPFKIPTGSMQPTLYGIHFDSVAPTEELKPSLPKRVLDYCNDSYRYVDAVSENGGSFLGASESKNIFQHRIFWPYVDLQFGYEKFRMPGQPVNVGTYVSEYRDRYYPESNSQDLAPGQVIARGHLNLGDHLFVDRVTLHFKEPKRGDIIVFNTTGISYNGRPLGGHFYIKRLVGLPGEKLSIRNGKLFVKGPDDADFRVVDGKDHAAFDRMYSGNGGYCGYTNEGQHLFAEDGVISLGDDEYCMMGDNSANSADSRYWGVVPRKNIVGRALFIYWPFSERWGFVDSIDPKDMPTTQCGRAAESLLE
ncbi:MAG: signal peptidase I [Rhodothermales bacterium]|jgi:signal peptidase I